MIETTLNKFYYLCTGVLLLFVPYVIMAEQFELPRNDGSSIHFYLKHSNTVSQDSLLILLQGSDCNSVDNNISLNTDLPKMFPDADVLTVEKYGITNILPYSKEDVRSDGALVGEMFTAKSSEVTMLISLVGGADYLLDDMRYNLLQTVPPEELTEQQDAFEAFIKEILTAKDPIIMNEDNELGFKWFKSILSLSRYDSLSQITQPILLIDCGRDSNTSPIESDKLYQRLNENNKTNITRIIYPELDHFFTNKSGKRVLDNVIFDGRQWLKSHIENK
ncbi:alpha/beta hydrolase family protein [Orbus mooreae]|uniref:alpha/beta hydrolase family protein n=1 Tax=Orbus mooreae TaxID=3074107 RepID=UPI00370D8016